MIYSLNGTILENSPGLAVIECGGVGYLLHMPLTAAGALGAPGAKATVFTHLNVSENDVSLFGFSSAAEREMFLLLTGVSGVGPKVGLAILSALPPQSIALAVSAGDFKAFTAASGVGPKLAQRLVLELKDKVGAGSTPGGISLADISAAAAAPQGAAQQAMAALVALGYSQSEAASAIAPIDPALPVGEITRLALRGLGQGR
ncbi:MAG: Holliday junction branch migration protein RuvA [Oscillospiraceae bacterium]